MRIRAIYEMSVAVPRCVQCGCEMHRDDSLCETDPSHVGLYLDGDTLAVPLDIHARVTPDDAGIRYGSPDNWDPPSGGSINELDVTIDGKALSLPDEQMQYIAEFVWNEVANYESDPS